MDYAKRNRKLVVALSLLFVAALVHRTGVLTRLGGSDPAVSRNRDSEVPVDAGVKVDKTISLRHLNLPESKLDELLEYSPFGVSPDTAVAVEEVTGESGSVVDESENSSTEAKSTVTLRLKAVYESEHGPVALVGSRLVRVGDVLDDGSRVLSIRGRELILAVKTSAGTRVATNDVVDR